MAIRPAFFTLLISLLVIAATTWAGDLAKCKKPDGSLYVGPTPPADCVPVGTASMTNSSGAAHTSEDAADEAAAIQSCKDKMESMLVSPGTASWKVQAVHRGGTRYDVGGSVDSQNRGGGLMRSTFVCDTEYLGTGIGWRAHVSFAEDGGSGKAYFNPSH